MALILRAIDAFRIFDVVMVMASRSIPVMSTFVYINYFDFQDPYSACRRCHHPAAHDRGVHRQRISCWSSGGEGNWHEHDEPRLEPPGGNRRRRESTVPRRLLRVGFVILAVFFAMLTVAPLLVLLKVSISAPEDVMTAHPPFLIYHPTFEHWRRLLDSGEPALADAPQLRGRHRDRHPGRADRRGRPLRHFAAAARLALWPDPRAPVHADVPRRGHRDAGRDHVPAAAG